jgi:hypothetical protein
MADFTNRTRRDADFSLIWFSASREYVMHENACTHFILLNSQTMSFHAFHRGNSGAANTDKCEDSHLPFSFYQTVGGHDLQADVPI